MAVEELNGEVKFSTQLPYPNNLSRLAAVFSAAFLSLFLTYKVMLSVKAVFEPIVFWLLFRTLLKPMEALLQLMLNWDPVQRGGRVNSETKKPLCFEVLEQILSMKAS